MPPIEYVSLPNLFSVSVFGFAVRLAKLSLPFYKIKNAFHGEMHFYRLASSMNAGL